VASGGITDVAKASVVGAICTNLAGFAICTGWTLTTPAVDIGFGRIELAVLASCNIANVAYAFTACTIACAGALTTGFAGEASIAPAINIRFITVQLAIFAGVAIAFAVEAIAEHAIGIDDAALPISAGATTATAVDVRFCIVLLSVSATCVVAAIGTGDASARTAIGIDFADFGHNTWGTTATAINVGFVAVQFAVRTSLGLLGIVAGR
jgi:hypothetical protein